MLEQERDAFKTLAKNEEDVARIAAEGKLPLPDSSGDEGDESGSRKSRARVSSVTLVDVKTSATSEGEIDELMRLWLWEKERADRAYEMVDFLEAECQLRLCSGAKAARNGRSSISSLHRKRGSIFKIADAGDLVILSDKAIPASPSTRETSPKRSKTEMLREEQNLRRSTVFVPSEGIFRTVSQAEAEALNRSSEQRTITPTSEASPKTSPLKSSEPPTPAEAMAPRFARTPSVEPPDFAISGQQRTSLLSLLDAPHEPEPTLKGFHVPTTPGPMALSPQPVRESTATEGDTSEVVIEQSGLDTPTQTAFTEPVPQAPAAPVQEPAIRPHTSATCYTTTTTTTRVPLREETDDPSLAQRIMKLQRTPSRSGEPPSFDVNNAALTPTMTREQALAAIRERRGRARSMGKIVPPAVTPKRPMGADKENRNISAPTGKVGGGPPLGVTPGRRIRS